MGGATEVADQNDGDRIGNNGSNWIDIIGSGFNVAGCCADNVWRSVNCNVKYEFLDIICTVRHSNILVLGWGAIAE